MQNFKPLASLCSSAGRFESYLVGNNEDRFSRDVAHIKVVNKRVSFGENSVQGRSILRGNRNLALV